MFKSKGQRIFSVLLAGLMVTASMNVGAIKVFAQENQTETYEIYPIPHDIAYSSGEFDFSGNINVVYGEGIDEATKSRLQEVADLKDSETLSESTEIKDGKNILIGISGKDDVVNAEFKKLGITVDTEGLFESKLYSYILYVTDNNIIVLGKDEDSAFYGLTTLYHIIKQLPDNTITSLEVEDYSDVASRGFIEGYYGNPWSTEDRAKLMEWGGYYKLNSYFYAPKDDPKHNAKWRELYTPEEIETKIKPLAEAGNKSKCRFVYALHPYMYSPINHNDPEQYKKDLASMQAKFEQVIDAGVRQIAILADDAANVGGSNYIKMLTDMTQWLEQKRQQPGFEDLKIILPFCTQEYMYNGESYYKDFPSNVQIVMTGGKVWGEVSQGFTDTFTKNAGRGPYMWINWPCTDNSKKHLIMGGFKDFLHVGVNPENIQGIVLNPMQQSEPSKVAIFGNACYSWNIWDSEEQADTAWENSFKYVDHNSAIETDGSNALKELSKHMINQAMDSRVRVLQESVELKKKLTPFKEALISGNVDESMIAQIDDLINEFEVLENATATYNSNAGDQRLKEQIVYWLNCWEDTNSAAISYLNAIKSYINGEENDKIFDLYSAGKNSFEKSKTYGFNYIDHTEYAEVGVQHIVPFIKAMENYLSDVVSTFVNPEKQIIKPITNRNDQASINDMIDGNDSTYAQWKNPNESKVGEYMGISYQKPIDVTEVKFLVSNSDSGKVNGFASSHLEYTTDGKNWETIEGTQQDKPVYEISATNLSLKDVKGLRVICDKDTPDIWPAVREIYVNGKPVNYDPNKYENKVIHTEGYTPSQNTSESALTDGNDDTFVWYSTPKDASNVGDYVGIDLGKVMTIDTVRFIMGASGNDHWNKYDLEYSTDGTEYKKFKSYEQENDKKVVEEKFDNIEARYVRVKNTEYKKVWLKMSEFKVVPVVDSVDTNNESLKDLSVDKDFDTMTISTKDNITLNKGEYIGIDLGRIRDINNIDIQTTNGDALTLEVSKNYDSWTTINRGVQENLNARYVRLINNTDEAVTFDLNKYEIKTFEIQTPFLHSSNVGINPSWGVSEDSRNNGGAFDGKVDTTTEFADFPQKDQYIIYDLGQERTIRKLQLINQDSAVNYIRDAEILVSNDINGDWTKVVTIGDGIENKSDANVKCIDATTESGTAIYPDRISAYPNKVAVTGELQTPATARYLKINFTASNNNRAVLFNEILINDGEYVSVSNDPTFESNVIEVAGMIPQNMIDDNLNTSYRPNTKENGYIKYTLSEKLDVSKLNIIQNGEASNATVTLLVQKDGQEPESVNVGTLSKSLNEFFLPFWDKLLEVRIDWEAEKIPTIDEMIFINNDIYGTDHSELDTAIKNCTVEESEYTTSSYQEFKLVYDEAVTVNENLQSTQEQLNQAKEKLETVFTKLVKRGDVSLIQAELDTISQLNKEDYTVDSWEKLQIVVNEANKLLENQSEVSVSQVDEMVLKLQQAKTNLVLVDNVTKDDLQNLINGLENTDTSKYMSQTVKDFEEALAKAKEIVEAQQAAQEDVVKAYSQLQNAFDNLILKATEEQINQLKDLINSFKESSYTSNSWKEFALVIDEVNKALESEISSVDVDNLKEKVDTASKKLIIKGNVSRVEELLNMIPSLDSSKYTKDSYNNLMNVVKEVKERLKDSGNLSQDDVNILVDKLESAYKALISVDNNSNSSNNNSNNTNNGNNNNVVNTADKANLAPALIALLSMLSLTVIIRKKKLFDK